MHRAHTTGSALSHGKYRFNLLVINQEIDTMDPINGKNFRKINNVTNYTKPNSFPFKETIGRKGIHCKNIVVMVPSMVPRPLDPKNQGRFS